MKKFAALMMALAMLLVSVSAFAETTETAYTYTEYTYDETLFAEIGGDWMALEELGVMFYLPDIYIASEVPEQLAEMGTIAIFGNGDGVSAFTIAYGPAVDVNGNPAATIEDMAAYFTATGATNVDIINVNGIQVVTALDGKDDSIAYSVYYEDGTQLIMSFIPASDTNNALMAGLMITSLMPIPAAE